MKKLIALSTLVLAAGASAAGSSKGLQVCDSGSGNEKVWVSFMYPPKKGASPAYAATTLCGPRGFADSEAGLKDALEGLKVKYDTTDVIYLMIRKLSS